jgi:hypothetical protein
LNKASIAKNAGDKWWEMPVNVPKVRPCPPEMPAYYTGPDFHRAANADWATWAELASIDSGTYPKTGNKVVTPVQVAAGDMIKSSWLRVSNNTAATGDADRLIATADAQHVFGRFG